MNKRMLQVFKTGKAKQLLLFTESIDSLTFVLATVIATPFTCDVFALVHGHRGQLLPVVGILHIGYFFTQVLLLGKAFFDHAHVLEVLHGLVRLRVLLVSIVCSTAHISKSYKL